MKKLLLLMLLLFGLSVNGQTKMPLNTMHCMCIGKYAGQYLTTQKYVLIIGDKNKNDMTDYHDYQIDINPNFWYFKTSKGKQDYAFIKGFLYGCDSFMGGSGAWEQVQSERIIKLQKWIWENIWPSLK